ncbi:hypothetical protein V6N11_008368 [Hibiscus sabdariffa]|uniref:Uncharacterized protein n=1 Tax=Hibiscus sabdariffa TaxID=183260 RepID=A0ABR2NMU0_9ROSI
MKKSAIPSLRVMCGNSYVGIRVCDNLVVSGTNVMLIARSNIRIGSADRLGPWFDALLAQWCLEEYADHITLPVVFSLPAEVDVSAGT